MMSVNHNVTCRYGKTVKGHWTIERVTGRRQAYTRPNSFRRKCVRSRVWYLDMGALGHDLVALIGVGQVPVGVEGLHLLGDVDVAPAMGEDVKAMLAHVPAIS